jgi:hypothetical protein
MGLDIISTFGVSLQAYPFHIIPNPIRGPVKKGKVRAGYTALHLSHNSLTSCRRRGTLGGLGAGVLQNFLRVPIAMSTEL